ncbi:MAG: helix-turn-helix domain-containing protein [Coriobacteriales bacterium]|jgi:excisionase family DNA binding protein|nr:helix-turn-helix domain-containing protein [Coriobacteriales bacterium]
MKGTVEDGALASRQEAPAPPLTSTNEGNNGILSGLPPVLTLEQTAKALQIPLTTARQMCRTERLPAFKVGQQWRVVRSLLTDRITSGGVL